MSNLFDDRITKKDLETNLDPQWKIRLGEDLFERSYWTSIMNGINESIVSKGAVIPRKNQIFMALNRFDASNFRVLMIGQDPYPTPGNATGFAFASARGRPAPASLKQVFKEIDQEYGSNMYKDKAFNGMLDGWIDQGVLLLNTALTIGLENESHRDIGWRSFIGEVITYLDSTYKFVTLALGADAARVASDYVIKNRTMTITTGHPSPLNRSRPFVGCKCFEKANSLLLANNMIPIKWTFTSKDEK